jgi:hypothetical protein
VESCQAGIQRHPNSGGLKTVSGEGVERMEVCGRPDETKDVLQWHEHAFLQRWRWKSRRKRGRPTISQEMRALIRRLSRENVLWSAETIHGHLLAPRFRSTLPRHHQEVYGQDSGRNGQVPKLVDLPAKSPPSVLGHGLFSRFLLFAFKSCTSL